MNCRAFTLPREFTLVSISAVKNTKDDTPLHPQSCHQPHREVCGWHPSGGSHRWPHLVYEWRLVKKAQQRLHFLRRMRRAALPPAILPTFCGVEPAALLTASLWGQQRKSSVLLVSSHNHKKVTPHTPIADCSPCWPPERSSASFGAGPPGSAVVFCHMPSDCWTQIEH